MHEDCLPLLSIFLDEGDGFVEEAQNLLLWVIGDGEFFVGEFFLKWGVQITPADQNSIDFVCF